MSHLTEREGLRCRIITFRDQILIEGINTVYKSNQTLAHPSESTEREDEGETGSNPAEITDEPV